MLKKNNHRAIFVNWNKNNFNHKNKYKMNFSISLSKEIFMKKLKRLIQKFSLNLILRRRKKLF